MIGPDNHGSEKKVSIGASDNYSPYDWGLTTKIINFLAKANNINYCVDKYYRFGSDATAAIRAVKYDACCIWGWLYEFAWL